jgi:hypothetical protein
VTSYIVISVSREWGESDVRVNNQVLTSQFFVSRIFVYGIKNSRPSLLPQCVVLD